MPERGLLVAGIMAVILLCWIEISGSSQKPTFQEVIDKVEAMDNAYQACCETRHGNIDADEDLEYLVRLRRKINDLEARVEVLENVAPR